MERLVIHCTLFLGCCILAAGSLPSFIALHGQTGALLAYLMFPVMAAAALVALLFIIGDMMK